MQCWNRKTQLQRMVVVYFPQLARVCVDGARMFAPWPLLATNMPFAACPALDYPWLGAVLRRRGRPERLEGGLRFLRGSPKKRRLRV